MRNCMEIEGDIHSVATTFFSGVIGGGVYLSETRPKDSVEEDAVVWKVTAKASQFQGGAGRVLVFVPDIDCGAGHMVPDKRRMLEIAAMSDSLVDALNASLNGYWFSLAGATTTGSYPDGREHFVDIQLKFTYETF